VLVYAVTGHADEPLTVEQRLELLEKTVKAQQELIFRQQQQLLKQQLRLDILQQDELQDVRAAGLPQNSDVATDVPVSPPNQPPTTAGDQPVGVPPAQEEQERPPQVTLLSEQGGVLTPAGSLVLEPSLEYSHASQNRLTFRGVELQDVVLIGVIEASDADRDLVSPALTARYGITNRLEVEAKVPYIYRHDRLSFTIPRVDEPDIQRSETLSGDGLGDVEVAAHYQINGEAPYFIANMRLRTPTGEGPFDINRDSFGVEEELATGSGFFSVQPSITILYPTDPAVLFASLGYDWNVEDDIDKTIGGVIIGTVDPGDAIELTVGMGFAVNDELSFSLGYKHAYVLETRTEVTDTTTGARRTNTSSTLTLGSLLFGLGYRLQDNINLNLDLELGITDDSPDMRATFRVPIAFKLE
jgi:hypothetical protein